MTDTNEMMQTRIWTPGGFIEDEWHKPDGAAGLPGRGKVLIAREVFLALDPRTLKSMAGRIGVSMEPQEELGALKGHLSSISLVALSFPAFSDGRAYSKAALLRSRYAFQGTLRATGDILFDQVALMIRAGFDELEISSRSTLARLAAGHVGGLALHYQPAQRNEAKSDHYSWRRRAA